MFAPLLRFPRRAAAVAATTALSFALSSAFAPATAGGPGDAPIAARPAAAAPADRFIVKLRDPSADPRTRLPAIAGRTGQSLAYVRAMSGGAHVVRVVGAAIDARAGQSAAEANRNTAQRLMRDPEVAYAEPDHLLQAMLTPNDTMYSQQWNYYEAAGGIDLPGAWDITTGSTGIVVAVIDTGIRPHVDLAGRTVPGYDFVSDATISNDGDGRDPDASDPGDYGSCGNSTWHGTHVSGTIGAASNNGTGVTGVNWVSKILPARVLGACGGRISDIADAMRWSAGIAVPGVPNNANPARVENLSLGAQEACSNTMQSAINDVVARGAVVVVAAGNSNTDSASSEPANCSGVVSVAASTRAGGRASFSNYGSLVTIAAPGTSILSTLNSGSTTPGADSYAYYSGTSMATPHVAGVASLILSQNPALTPAQVKARLQATARAFPAGSDCTTAICGAGIVDARAALTTAPPAPRVNLASQANGAVASASSVYSNGYAPSGVNNGDRKGANWGSGGGWNDSTPDAFPDWLRVDFPRAATISEIDVFSVQDNFLNPVEPDPSMTFSLYGLVDFDIQYWDGNGWVTVPGGGITGNRQVWRKVTFPPVTTTAIRVNVSNALGTWSRVTEIEAYGDAPPVNVARSANGGVATASSTYSNGYPPSGAIDGDRRGANWSTGTGWNDGTADTFPDTLQVNFDGVKSIGEIDVFSVQDNFLSPAEPTPTMTFTLYGLVDFDVQYWTGSAWATVPNGAINGNNLVWRKLTFPSLSTNAIRLNVRRALGTWSRVTEIEAYAAP